MTKSVRCPHCGAPCRTAVLMRGGENGWGDYTTRTVHRYDPSTHEDMVLVSRAALLTKLREGLGTDGTLYQDVQALLGVAPTKEIDHD